MFKFCCWKKNRDEDSDESRKKKNPNIPKLTRMAGQVNLMDRNPNPRAAISKKTSTPGRAEVAITSSRVPRTQPQSHQKPQRPRTIGLEQAMKGMKIQNEVQVIEIRPKKPAKKIPAGLVMVPEDCARLVLQAHAKPSENPTQGGALNGCAEVAQGELHKPENGAPPIRSNQAMIESLTELLGASSLTFLGKGTFGEAFALDLPNPGLPKLVFKVLRNKDLSKDHCKKFTRSALEEFRIQKGLSHCNIARAWNLMPFFEKSSTGHFPYYGIVMERLEMNLFDYIKTKRFENENVFNRLFYQVGSALEYMHSKHVVHHDIKPGNIMISSVGNQDPMAFTYKIIDFGSAVHYPGKRVRESQKAGTIIFFSPEKAARPVASYDPYKADVYALGLTLMHCCVDRQLIISDRKLRGSQKLDKYLESEMLDWMSDELKACLTRMVMDHEGERSCMEDAMVECMCEFL